MLVAQHKGAGLLYLECVVSQNQRASSSLLIKRTHTGTQIPSRRLDDSAIELPVMAKGSPFATFLIVGRKYAAQPSPHTLTGAPPRNTAVCFFLGLLFANFPYDYYVLWALPPTTTTTATGSPLLSREPYFAQLETHLRALHASPPLIARVLHIVIGTGIIGLIAKLYKPTEANMLFDGASLVLYLCGVTVYIANTVKGLRVVTSGVYGEADVDDPTRLAAGKEGLASGVADDLIVGREDTLKVFAASNTILALVLIGVLVLQAGQWYAQRKEDKEIEDMDRLAADQKKEARATAKSPVREKKRQ